MGRFGVRLLCLPATVFQFRRHLHRSIPMKNFSSVMKKMKLLAFGEENESVKMELPQQMAPLVEQAKMLADGCDTKMKLPLADVENRLENIVRTVSEDYSPKTRGDWRYMDISDIVIKFQVIQKCYEEFGVLVPNNFLSSMKTSQDLLSYYGSLQDHQKNTFTPIDLKSLPSNLSIYLLEDCQWHSESGD